MKVREKGERERERDRIKLSSMCIRDANPARVERTEWRQTASGGADSVSESRTRESVCLWTGALPRACSARIYSRVRSAHAQDRVSCGEAAQLSIMFLLPNKVNLCEAASHGLVTDSNDSHSE